jgi:hypothetical protein
MSDEQPKPNEVPQGGVFGKLPDSRPGSRSPRRDAAAKAKSKSRAATANERPTPTQRPKPAPKATPSEPREPRAQRPPPPAAADAGAHETGAGLDDLAWAGVAAVAEAATFGVRLANRAFGALRGGDDSDEPR